jgi:hypothetical protein
MKARVTTELDRVPAMDELRQSGIGIDRLSLCRKTGRLPAGHRVVLLVQSAHAFVPGKDPLFTRGEPRRSTLERPPTRGPENT